MPIPVQVNSPSDLVNHLKPLAALPKGDLYVKFDIYFPDNIEINQKNRIVELFRKNAEEVDC